MMSLINTAHMAEREESFTGDRDAPITDGSHCYPIVPFCVHPPVFCGSPFFSAPQQFVADAIGSFILC